MKINPNYILRNIAGEHVVVPTGEEGVNFNGIITLNESGKLLFETLKTGVQSKDLVDVLINKYDVNLSQAQEDVEAFLETLRSKNVLIEDE